MTITRPDMFTDVTSEYLALRREGGVVPDLYGVVTATGSDAMEFLNGIITQEMTTLTEGVAARSFLLEPRGKLNNLLWVVRDRDRILLLAIDAEAAKDALSRYLIRVDAELTVDGTMSLVAGAEGVDGYPVPIRGLSGAVVTEDPPPDLPHVGEVAWNTIRIEAGEPLMGVDVDEKTIPQETGLEDEAVSFAKGCYLGQELVARINTRGHVNKRLVGLTLSRNVLPPPGAEIVHEDKKVGVMTSVGESLDLMTIVALATVRSEVDYDTMVDVVWDGESNRAQVRNLPLVGS